MMTNLFARLLSLSLLGAGLMTGCGGVEGDEAADETSEDGISISGPIILFRPDLKIHIDAFSPATGLNSCLGTPALTGYVTVKNMGIVNCNNPQMPTAFGYFPVAGSAVLFQVTSVGPMPASIAPGAELHVIVQATGTAANVCLGQQAIANGYFEINQPVCGTETVVNNNKATRVLGTTYNPQ